jgi:hypothetical protein
MKQLLFLLSMAVAGWSQTAPRPDLTPGATLPVTTAQVCIAGYSKETRGEHKISAKTKREVMAAYGLDPKAKGYVIDHLISLEAGGSNDRRNLQPQTVAEGHFKDRLENYLHRRVCATPPSMTLVEAQRELAGDWRVAYWTYFHSVTRAR